MYALESARSHSCSIHLRLTKGVDTSVKMNMRQYTNEART